jgi:hypothetical protein
MLDISPVKGHTMTIIQALLIGALTGGLGTSAIVIGLQARSAKLSNIQEQQGQAIQELAGLQATIAAGELDIQKALTAPDLLSEACSSEYMELSGDLLCREMFCRLQTREGDGASQQECESMANISNSLHILRACSDMVTPEWENCVRVFESRK